MIFPPVAAYTIQNFDRFIEVSPLISKEHEQRIRESLSAFLSGRIATVSPIKRGHQEARNYFVESEGAKYLLKLLPFELSESDALKELYMIEAGSSLGIAPHVVFASNALRAVLMEYTGSDSILPQRKPI